MKNLVFLLAFLLLPINAHAFLVKFSSYTVEFPEGYSYKTGNSGIEIYDENKKNIVIIFVLPEVGQDIASYSAELLAEYKGEDLDYNEEEQVYYFTFKDADYGQCDAIVKEIKKKLLFITYGGDNKEAMIEIVNSIE